MRILIDLNVLLDVLQKREPFYADSAKVLSLAREDRVEAAIPSHAVTTLHYIIESAATTSAADKAIDWLLKHFTIASADRSAFLRSRELEIPDFEDAVVASLAEATDCASIVSRNEKDFANSPVPAISPSHFLIQFA